MGDESRIGGPSITPPTPPVRPTRPLQASPADQPAPPAAPQQPQSPADTRTVTARLGAENEPVDRRAQFPSGPPPPPDREADLTAKARAIAELVSGWTTSDEEGAILELLASSGQDLPRLLEILDSQGVTVETLADELEDPNRNMQVALDLANNPAAPPGLLSRLAEAPEPEVRTAVANNPRAKESPAILARLSGDSNEGVRDTAWSREDIDSEELTEAQADRIDELASGYTSGGEEEEILNILREMKNRHPERIQDLLEELDLSFRDLWDEVGDEFIEIAVPHMNNEQRAAAFAEFAGEGENEQMAQLMEQTPGPDRSTLYDEMISALRE